MKSECKNSKLVYLAKLLQKEIYVRLKEILSTLKLECHYEELAYLTKWLQKEIFPTHLTIYFDTLRSRLHGQCLPTGESPTTRFIWPQVLFKADIPKVQMGRFGQATQETVGQICAAAHRTVTFRGHVLCAWCLFTRGWSHKISLFHAAQIWCTWWKIKVIQSVNSVF